MPDRHQLHQAALRYAQLAVDLCERALPLLRTGDDERGEAKLLGHLGAACNRTVWGDAVG